MSDPLSDAFAALDDGLTKQQWRGPAEPARDVEPVDDRAHAQLGQQVHKHAEADKREGYYVITNHPFLVLQELPSLHG